MTITRRFGVLLLTLIVMTGVSVPAWAHVTVRADNTAPEAFAKYTVRVPNESDDAATVKVDVELPEGFDEARYQPVEGWDITVAEGVLTIEGGRVDPGQFQEFSFSARNPAEPGDITFPAIQTYEDGEVVRWVGDPESEEPAAVVTIAGEAGGHGGGAEAAETEATEAGAASDSAPSTDISTTLAVVALIAGLAGAGLGGAAFARVRNTG